MMHHPGANRAAGMLLLAMTTKLLFEIESANAYGRAGPGHDVHAIS